LGVDVWGETDFARSKETKRKKWDFDQQERGKGEEGGAVAGT